MHPDVQEKISKELSNVFESKDEDVTTEKLGQLTYMEMVIKELLRFWPPIGFMIRKIQHDMNLGFEANFLKKIQMTSLLTFQEVMKFLVGQML